ncbi:calcium-dependent protein kinase [Dorcoceras hygrometricum]|uniref:Calcium-dependent protein kinase n=1 Tax=Dorcoceras hygrometricum TaxID=472368 RepID=A0A2Z7A8H2_9LAMI|nr:calcium-dependent protein kinase [Dorcoceras hygrometricum]
MVNDTDEVFDFSSPQFTREDLVTALNNMVLEYKKLSQSFEKVKVKIESCVISAELVSSSNMQATLSKLEYENTEDTASGTEGGESHIAQPVGKEIDAADKRHKKIRKEKIVNKQRMVMIKTAEAVSQAAPAKSTSVTSSDVDSLPLSRLKRSGAAPKLEGDEGSTTEGPEDTVATPPELEMQDGDGSNIPAQDDHMECRNETSNVDEQEERMGGVRPCAQSE